MNTVSTISGIIMEKVMICIGCPMGCDLKVNYSEESGIISVTGNTCKRGEEYAKNECTNPKRTLTTTIRCQDGKIISVRSNRAIPKDKIFDAMKIINQIHIKTPVQIGDVVAKDIFGSDIIATQNYW